MKDKDSDKRWSNYYFAEQCLFDFISANANTLIEHDPPEYLIVNKPYIGVVATPPKYVRGIYQIKEKSYEADFIKLLEKKKKLFIKAVGKEFKRFPIRTAQYYENVTQINISLNQAYESLKIRPNQYFTIFFLPVPRDEIERNIALEILNTLIAELESINIHARTTTSRVGLGVAINTNHLFEYANTTNIQARRPSGDQYRALLRHTNETKGNRIKYGFIVINAESNCRVFASIPEAERPHTLNKTGNVITLDNVKTALPYTLYDKG